MTEKELIKAYSDLYQLFVGLSAWVYQIDTIEDLQEVKRYLKNIWSNKEVK